MTKFASTFFSPEMLKFNPHQSRCRSQTHIHRIINTSLTFEEIIRKFRLGENVNCKFEAAQGLISL